MKSETEEVKPEDKAVTDNAVALEDAIRKGECDDWVVPGSHDALIEESFRE